MNLICYDDNRGWGRSLAEEANRKNWNTKLFTGTPPKAKKPTPLFMCPTGGGKLNVEKAVIERASFRFLEGEYGNLREYRLIPNLEALGCCENMIEQAFRYARFMPKTSVIMSKAGACLYLGGANYPFISKSSSGGGARIIRDRSEALGEVEKVFVLGSPGMALRPGHSEEYQRDYLIWQERLPVICQCRVVVVGGAFMVMEKVNRKFSPIPHHRALGALAFAASFSDQRRFKWGAIDLVYCSDGHWSVLGTRLSWDMLHWLDCPFFRRTAQTLAPGKGKGRDIWRLTLDAIEQGAFQ